MATKEQVLKRLAKKLPEGSFRPLGEVEDKEIISTSIPTLDYALGTGGFARGEQVMVYGEPSSGKSALTYSMMGTYMKEHPNSMCAILDLEDSASMSWCNKFGLDADNTIVLSPATIDECITTAIEVIRDSCFDIIVIDSLGAGILQSELENDTTRMGGSAGAITRLVKAIKAECQLVERQKRVAQLNGENTDGFVIPVVIHINQVRDNLKSMYGGLTYSGGHALSHSVAQVIRIRASKAATDKIEGTVNGEKHIVGSLVNCTVEKNKLAPPNRSGSYIFCFEECPEHAFGIDATASVCDLALCLGIARVEGKTIYFPTPHGEEKVVGKKKFDTYIRENEDVRNFLAGEISNLKSDEFKVENAESDSALVNKFTPVNEII